MSKLSPTLPAGIISYGGLFSFQGVMVLHFTSDGTLTAKYNRGIILKGKKTPSKKISPIK